MQDKVQNITPEEVEKAKKESYTPVEAIKPGVEPVTPVKTTETEYLCAMKAPAPGALFEPKSVLYELISGTERYKGTGATKDGQIYIRRFTTKEENELQKEIAKISIQNEAFTLDKLLGVLNTILNNCIKSSVNITQLPLIEKVPLFVKLVTLTYGSKLEVEIECEDCEEKQKITIDLDKDLIIKRPKKNFKMSSVIELSSFDFPITMVISLPLIKDERFFSSDFDIIEQIKSMTVEIVGTKPDGTDITFEDLNLIISNLNKEDKAKIKKFVETFDEIGTDLKVKPKQTCFNVECEKYNTTNENIQIQVFDLLSKLIDPE